MEGVKEVSASFVDWFKHRLVNPFYASFLFSWLAINWRLVLAFASDKPFNEKIEWIEKHAQPFWYAEGLPLIISIAYIIVGPVFYRQVVTYHRRQQNLTRDKLHSIDGQATLTESAASALRSESLRIRAEARTQQENAEKQHNAALEEIDKLNKRLQSAQQRLASLDVGRFEKKGVAGSADRIFLVDLDLVSNSLPSELATRGITQAESNVLKLLFSRLDEGVDLNDIQALFPNDVDLGKEVVAQLRRLMLAKMIDDTVYLTQGGRNAAGQLLDGL